MKRQNAPLIQSDAMKKVRCEGWRRNGGAFTLGPVTWKQCEETAIVMLTVKQAGEKTTTKPACVKCWKECSEQAGVKIFKVVPL